MLFLLCDLCVLSRPIHFWMRPCRAVLPVELLILKLLPKCSIKKFFQPRNTRNTRKRKEILSRKRMMFQVEEGNGRRRVRGMFVRGIILRKGSSRPHTD